MDRHSRGVSDGAAAGLSPSRKARGLRDNPQSSTVADASNAEERIQVERERDRLYKALSNLVQASAPIAEDGGSDEQHERFNEVFADACFTVEFPHVDPGTGERP